MLYTVHHTDVEITEDLLHIEPAYLTEDNKQTYKHTKVDVWCGKRNNVTKYQLEHYRWYGIQLHSKSSWRTVAYGSMKFVQGMNVIKYINKNIKKVNNPVIAIVPMVFKDGGFEYQKSQWVYVLNSALIDVATYKNSTPYKLGWLKAGTDNDIDLYTGTYFNPNQLNENCVISWNEYDNVKNNWRDKGNCYGKGSFMYAIRFYKWYVTWCYRLTGKKSKLYDLIIVSNLESDIDNTLYQIENNGQSSLSAHQKQLFEVAKIIIDNVYDVVHNVGK